MLRLPRVLAVVALLGAGTALSACSTAVPGAAGTSVVVRVAPSERPVDVEVHVVEAAGDHREVQRMRSGESRRFAVPAGWVTVRVPGLCVVPTRSAATVEVDRTTCRVV